MHKAIIIGATSGMGRELAILLAQKQFKVGIAGRRKENLDRLHLQYPEHFHPWIMDITGHESIDILERMVNNLGGLDLLVLTAGYGKPYEPLNPLVTQQIINTNVKGFTRVVDWGVDYFLRQGHGQLVSFSSVAGIRGCGVDPAYCASNAFKMHYLEGLRQVIDKTELPVYLTDIRPGFIEKPDTQVENRFWVYSLGKATKQIYRAIEKKKQVAYVSKRWGLVAGVMNVMPENIYNRVLQHFIRPNGYGRRQWSV